MQDLELENQTDIRSVCKAIENVAPTDIVIFYDFPGVCTVINAKDEKINIGSKTLLDGELGWSWNNEECTVAGEIADLPTASAVADAFWEQMKGVIA